MSLQVGWVVFLVLARSLMHLWLTIGQVSSSRDLGWAN